LGIDGSHHFFHLSVIVARSPHAVPRGGRAVRPTGAVTAVRASTLMAALGRPARPLPRRIKRVKDMPRDGAVLDAVGSGGGIRETEKREPRAIRRS